MSIKSASPASVLFVDDEEKARKYFALAMADSFDIRTAGSAAEALAILGEHAQQVAIIISDQRMPEETGVELLKTVRDRYPHIVRLLTTAYTDIEDAIEAINRGEILRYIQKPWDINTLRTELRQAMNYFQLRSERDALLKEKLSVKQSMLQIERISQLLTFAEALPYLRFSGHAMRRYIDQLIASRTTATDPAQESALMLDLWSQTLAETGRMKQFVRAVVAALEEQTPAARDFGMQLDLAALQALVQESAQAAGLQIGIADAAPLPEAGIAVNAILFRLMLGKLAAVLRGLGLGSVTLRLAATGTPEHGGLQMTFDGESGAADPAPLYALLGGPVTQEVPAACADLLLVFLACVHHGGSVEMRKRAGGASIVLSLPADPRAATLPADASAWHEKVLATFEPEIY